MSSEKKRRRWRRAPLLVEENLTIDSTSTTTSTRIQEEKHIENIRRRWYQPSKDDENEEMTDNKEIPLMTLLPDETIAEKIDRVLKKINAWTNETSTTTTTSSSAAAAASSDNNHHHQHPSLHQDTSFNKTSKSSANYDNLRQQCYPSTYTKPIPSSVVHPNRRRSSSSTRATAGGGGGGASPLIASPEISAHRPHSMTFFDEPFPVSSNQYSDQRSHRKVSRRDQLSCFVLLFRSGRTKCFIGKTLSDPIATVVSVDPTSFHLLHCDLLRRRTVQTSSILLHHRRTMTISSTTTII